MPHERINGEDVGRRAKEWYARLRPTVETEENIGKIISIDVATGDYFIGKDLLDTGQTMLARNPKSVLFGIRIGYEAAYTIGGSLKRSAPH